MGRTSVCIGVLRDSPFLKLAAKSARAHRAAVAKDLPGTCWSACSCTDQVDPSVAFGSLWMTAGPLRRPGPGGVGALRERVARRLDDGERAFGRRRLDAAGGGFQLRVSA